MTPPPAPRTPPGRPKPEPHAAPPLPEAAGNGKTDGSLGKLPPPAKLRPPSAISARLRQSPPLARISPPALGNFRRFSSTAAFLRKFPVSFGIFRSSSAVSASSSDQRSGPFGSVREFTERAASRAFLCEASGQVREKSVKMGENGVFLRGYEDFGVLWEILGGL